MFQIPESDRDLLRPAAGLARFRMRTGAGTEYVRPALSALAAMVALIEELGPDTTIQDIEPIED